ncbi:MAG: hypothetical protein HGA33_00565 [Candidatus Moranbacteria bacterium]|nr:hypothetical protein [Candidatus Moranbacteria bacterium]
MLHKDIPNYSVLARELNRWNSLGETPSVTAIDAAAKFPFIRELWDKNIAAPKDPPAWEGEEYIRWAIRRVNLVRPMAYMSKDELFALIDMGLKLDGEWSVRPDASYDFFAYGPGDDLPETRGFYAEKPNGDRLGLTLQWAGSTFAVAKSCWQKSLQT